MVSRGQAGLHIIVLYLVGRQTNQRLSICQTEDACTDHYHIHTCSDILKFGITGLEVVMSWPKLAELGMACGF